MAYNESSNLVLLVQNAYTVFCYFNISPMTVKEFEDSNGENSWKNSKPSLKVYSVQNGTPREISTILIDSFANNWYINLPKDDMDIFVKLGRMLPNDKFIAFAVSNTVTTPRSHESFDTSVYYVDVSESLKNDNYAVPAIEEKNVVQREPKPYPFMDVKKN